MDEWIKCSERMPSKDGIYIALCQAPDDPEYVPGPGVFAFFYFNGAWKNWFWEPVDYVTYWMPLPAPPEASNG